MTAPWTPMRWPRSWKHSAVDLLAGSGINCVLADDGADIKAPGVHAGKPEGPIIVNGEWPGVRLSRAGGDAVEGGPTGTPWINSNGWLVQLTDALHPTLPVWVDAPPAERPRSYLMAIADAAAHGARWIVTLDEETASGISSKEPEALQTWKSIVAATSFFRARKAWAGYPAAAEIGVISDFAGPNEFLSHELLNLITRAGQHCRPLPKSRPLALEGLRAILYADAAPPSAELRKLMLTFVEGGGVLIATPSWGSQPAGGDHPRYSIRAAGKGRIALAHAAPDDPFVMANDAVVLVSHRYDLVRFWNGGATGSVYTTSPGRNITVVHLLFYSDRGPDAASVRIVGRFRLVKASAPGMPEIPGVRMQPQKDAVEIHLPQVPPYVALELHS